MDKIQLGMVQTGADEDSAVNLQRNLGLIDQAAERGAQIIVLQELFLGPYFPQRGLDQDFARAETIPGPTTDALMAKAADKNVVIVGSIFERDGDMDAPGTQFYNTAVVIDSDGAFVGKYRKIHLPSDARFNESKFFSPGDLGFKVFDTTVGRIGAMICLDQWFPEAARLCAMQGAELLVYPSAIATWTGELEHMQEQQDAWQTVQRGHAVANSLFVCAVNRVGLEDELQFWGNSFVAGPDGSVLHACGGDEEVSVVELDLAHSKQWRTGWTFLDKRNASEYGALSGPYSE